MADTYVVIEQPEVNVVVSQPQVNVVTGGGAGQVLVNTSDATSHTVSLSLFGGSVKLQEGTNVTLATTGDATDGVVTISASGGGGGGTWGSITGTLSDQTDLQSALDAKVSGSGVGVANQIALFSGANSIVGDANFTYDQTTKALVTVGASSSFWSHTLASNSSLGPIFQYYRARAGTTAVTANTNLGSFVFNGYNGSSYQQLSAFDAIAGALTNDGATRMGTFRVKSRDVTSTLATVAEFRLGYQFWTKQIVNDTTTAATAAIGTGAGTGATTTVVSSSPNWVILNVTTGTTPTANGDLVTVTMPYAFPTFPYPVGVGASNAALADWNKFKWTAVSTTQWKITMVGTAATPATYSFYVHVAG